MKVNSVQRFGPERNDHVNEVVALGFVLSGSGWTVPRAAQRLGVTPAERPVRRAVLLADGLVELRPNRDNARSPVPQLTSLGLETLGRIREAARPWHEAVAAEISLADLERA